MDIKGKNITVFGGSGFLGTQLVKQLAEKGAMVKVISRFPEKAKHLRVNGPTGRIVLQSGNIRSEDSVRNALRNTDIAINLVGILYQKQKQRFDSVQARGAETIAKIASELKVKKLIHISALGIEKSGKSRYARSKYTGEQAVLNAFPNAVILRPSVIFGKDDSFFNKFASILALSPMFPLIGGGHTKFQPVYVGDVVKAICNAIQSEKANGSVYELGGPDIVTLKELLHYIKEQIHSKTILFPTPFSLASLMGSIFEFLPSPPLTHDQVRLLHHDNIVNEEALTLKDLGVDHLVSYKVIAPEYLKRYRSDV